MKDYTTESAVRHIALHFLKKKSRPGFTFSAKGTACPVFLTASQDRCAIGCLVPLKVLHEKVGNYCTVPSPTWLFSTVELYLDGTIAPNSAIMEVMSAHDDCVSFAFSYEDVNEHTLKHFRVKFRKDLERIVEHYYLSPAKIFAGIPKEEA